MCDVHNWGLDYTCYSTLYYTTFAYSLACQ